MKPGVHSFRFALVILLLLLVLTAVLGSRLSHVDVAGQDCLPVSTELPVHVGEWEGEDIFYCQNEQCRRSFLNSELGNTRVCLSCGGVVDKMALGEHNILPADTVLVRKCYRNPGGAYLTATIVLSGSEQKSIHRPQQCLPAQGFSIDSSRIISVTLPGRSPLGLTLLTARQGGAARTTSAPRMCMAYWFIGGGHETPSHFKRLAWMAWDNLVHGLRTRWAYVSLQTSANGTEAATEQCIADFTRSLYPLIHRDYPAQ